MYKEVAVMWENKESYVDLDGVFSLSIIKHVTLQKIVAHDFRYDPRNYHTYGGKDNVCLLIKCTVVRGCEILQEVLVTSSEILRYVVR